LFKRVNRTVDEKRLTDAQFLGVANAFDTIWFESLVQANYPQLPKLPGEDCISVPTFTDISNVLHSATSPGHGM